MVPRVLVICLYFLPAPVTADTLNQATVDFVDGIYQMGFDVEVNASQADVYRMLTDYEHLPLLNDMVKESHIVTRTGSGESIRETRLKFCVLFFCNTIRIVERLLENGVNSIKASVIPERSDLQHGETMMFIHAENGNRARIEYGSTIQPKFWVPPLIGPWIIRKKMKSELGVMMQRIESLVNENTQ